MELFIDLLKITIPALIVAFTTFYLIKQQFEQTRQKSKAKINKEILLLRLQAYERLILLMERITPDNLIMRIETAGYSVNEYHLELLSVIRAEFDHNISQQLYVSDLVWLEATNAKEEVSKLINIAFHQVQNPSILTINKKIVEKNIESNFPTQKAINTIKSEVRQLF